MKRRFVALKFLVICSGFLLGAAFELAAQPASAERLPKEPAWPTSAKEDWLIQPTSAKAAVYRTENANEIALANGLIRRVIRLSPNAATVAFDNLMTGAAILRGVKSEAVIVLDNATFSVGGLVGQEEYGYLKQEWLDSLQADPRAFHFSHFEVDAIQPRFEWNRKRYSEGRPWPPPGAMLTLHFRAPIQKYADLKVKIHYEIYQDLPLLAKWLEIENGGDETVRLNRFISEQLAVVEYESIVEPPKRWRFPNIEVLSDYAFRGMDLQSSNKTTFWVPDSQHLSQVNYQRKTPNLLESRPPLGPNLRIDPGQTFESFRTYELVYDSEDRERKGLAVRRMHRTLSPWATENPILMHVRRAEPEAVKLAIDQSAEVGFEMVILTFGSGFDAENESSEYLSRIKALADYAHEKGVELGGYSLLASRKISPEHDAINPKTGKPGGMIFGNSPCLGSAWGKDYFRKLRQLYEKTGLDLLEHDGSYPGDICASTSHPGHDGMEDSQWRQWRMITDFYKWCRAKGVYLNVPDFYFLSGSNKVAMGYRETNWSLPRERQIILGRQNIFDGTWEKTPSMGWMFVPLVEYHGGGAAATLEPLSEHLDAYGAHLAQNFGSGVQACYRGPRLFDSPATKAVVKKWVDFYKANRAILDSDMIHLQRADGRDWDGVLHVNPKLRTKGLAMLYNPTSAEIARTIALPLYYTGLGQNARVRTSSGASQEYALDRKFRIEVPVKIPARGIEWLIIK